ncbi:E2F-associated phosphoprotein isoform X2 [Camellia sinensis]|uniref:E2F-associated phosphoprotein isoform X2 n=1 Tax=Camellia sinensis TaxID=4442 RepID=UPI001035A50A|nr:E2F-associated phosphoprotein isoform X2 [Camellia sinensis]
MRVRERVNQEKSSIYKTDMEAAKGERERAAGAESPVADDSQQTISDDDEIDYSIKPEFYDPNLDDKDELWVQKQRKGHYSDAVLSCPACFTTLCLECQRHEKYVTQYRAVFVSNCKIKTDEVSPVGLKRKRGKRRIEYGDGGETFKPVCCSVCSTEVGVIDEEEVYHFFNALPSEC